MSAKDDELSELRERIRQLESVHKGEGAGDAIRALVEGLQKRNPSDLDQMGLSAERQAALTARSAGRRYRYVPLVGEGDVHAVGKVAEDPRYPNGVIVDMLEFRYPGGMLVHESEGGRVPDGMQIAISRDQEATIALLAASGKEPHPHACAFLYVQWKLTTFYWPNHRAWIGKELKSHFCDPAGEGLATAWSESDQRVAA